MIYNTVRMILYIVIPIAALTACAKVSEVPPREPISAAEVKRIASEVETITNAKVEAWNSGDFEAIQALYTDDIVFTEVTMDVHIVGIDDFMEMARGFIQSFPTLRRQVTNHFIGLEDSFATIDYWSFSLGGHPFTPSDPYLWVHLSQIRGDRYSSWTLFEGPEFIEKRADVIVDKSRFDEARLLLSSYASAWSSGDANLVGKLYADSAIRKDTIFQESQQGSEAMSSFARSFFAWYPGARWTLLQTFGEWAGESPTIGGTYKVEVSDATNQPCEVLVAVLLKASEGKITNETLYYEPDSNHQVRLGKISSKRIILGYL